MLRFTSYFGRKSKNMKTIVCTLISICIISGLNAQLLEKVTTGSIVDTQGGSRACILVDFNNDAYLDAFISNGTSGGENNLLYLNNGNGTFTAVASDASMDNAPSDGACAADYQNDGWIDLAVVNWYGDDNLLYANTGGVGIDLQFLDTSVISTDNGFSEAGSWGDFDNDGYLDLYVTNSAGNDKNALYRNLGNGTFEKLTAILPVEDAFLSRSVNWIDFDNDSDLDLFVTNEGNLKNNLYVNDGMGNFSSMINDTLVSDNFNSFTSSWTDVDNDGDFDVFIGNYQDQNQLFLNDGNGGFTAASGPWDLISNCTFSSSFADYDNDGDKDLFVTNGYCSIDLVNELYLNDGSGNFTTVPNEPISTDVGSSYGCAWGDVDNDGFLELLVANWQNETQENTLYINNGNANNWIKIHLEGTVSNHSAIGAKVNVLSTIGGVPTWQMHQVTTQSGYCSQNSLVAHFGLGDAGLVDSIVVLWPSGIVDSLVNISSNSYYELIEGGEWGVAAATELPAQENNIEVYPNPVKGGSIHIKFPQTATVIEEIELISLDGRVVQSKKNLLVETNEITMDINDSILSGMYLLRIHTSRNTMERTIQVLR